MKYVYEFTNQRKLTKAEFLKWFQKKALYIIKKFKMIQNNDVVVYENKGDFRGVVLEDVLKIFAEKGSVEVVQMRSLRSLIDGSKQALPNFSLKKLLHNNKIQAEKSDEIDFKAYKFRAKRGKLKFAIPNTIDTESDKLVHELIKGNAN